MGKGGEMFVLDMGRPVRIVDLARDMIRLSGLEPERDIPIVFTGVRPGEKLDEKLFNDAEEVGRTSHPKVSTARRSPYRGTSSSATSIDCGRSWRRDDIEAALQTARLIVEPASVPSVPWSES